MISSGLLSLPWWGDVLVALALTHVTIASVTIFLHRHQAHRALELGAVASHFSVLAMADHRDGYPAMGGDSPQAPCQV